MKFKHIIWDWNGTLLNDCHFTFLRTREVLETNGLDIPSFEYYLDNFTYPVEDFLVLLGIDKVSMSVDTLVEEFVGLYNEGFRVNCTLHPGVEIILSKIKEEGTRQHILSAREQELLLEDLHHYGIRKYFDNILGSESTSRYGKMTQGRKLIASLAAEPSEIVLIGDTVHDFMVSRELGIRCILIATGNNSRKRLFETGADIIIQKHEELPSYLYSSPRMTPATKEIINL